MVGFGSTLRASEIPIDSPEFPSALRDGLLAMRDSGAWDPASELEAPLMSVIEAYPNPAASAALACLEVFAAWPGGSGLPPPDLSGGGGPVHAAASFPGDGGWLRALARLGYPLDRPNRRGVTPLMLAARVGAAANAAILLDEGSDPRATDVQGRSVWEHGEPPDAISAISRRAAATNPVHALLSTAIERAQIDQAAVSPGHPRRDREGRL